MISTKSPVETLIFVNSSPGEIDFTCEKAEDPRIRNKQAIKLI